MFFEYALTIPANTAAASPTESLVALSAGRLVAVAVQFPRGCVGLVHTVAHRSEHQLWPTNPDGSIVGEGAMISWAEDLVLEDDPYTLRLRGWNLDDSYQHTVTWRFNVLPLAGVLADRERAALETRLRLSALGEGAAT